MEEALSAGLERVVFDFEPFVKDTLGLDVDGTLSGQLCRGFLRGTCTRGTACLLLHSYGTQALRFPSEKTVVCKHWLRGLCKKGDACEFLHEYNLKKMPECWFFTKYGECSNPDCFYLHVDPNSKMRECAWYKRGFCKHGPMCRSKHARNTACALYLTGFCPFGPNCQFGHPKYELPG